MWTHSSLPPLTYVSQKPYSYVLKNVEFSVNEDGDLSFRLRVGSVNCFVCHVLESDWIDQKNGGFEKER